MTGLFVPDEETQKRLEEEHIKRVLSKSLVHRQSELDAENAKLRARIAELEKMLAVHRLAVDVDALKARINELEAELKQYRSGK